VPQIVRLTGTFSRFVFPHFFPHRKMGETRKTALRQPSLFFAGGNAI